MLFSPFLSLAICLHHLFILFWWNLFLLIDFLQWQIFFPPFVFCNLHWFQLATAEVILSLSVLQLVNVEDSAFLSITEVRVSLDLEK